MIKANQRIRKGCLGYLACVNDAGKERLGVNYVDIVRDYPEVFPNHLAPFDMKEMMMQLQELHDKGFIYPNILRFREHHFIL
ncbi:hypothetical protein OSB04_019337 [Centaurea solstitialis]|uniref:Uncharacterized protein n=1 Tax=Centaurea solstitialis TaxID=347529 RepID=A0AA38SQ49_9ASTR|nr:hypothetical protein OSB04_019337 [Centaurea solstitialis]